MRKRNTIIIGATLSLFFVLPGSSQNKTKRSEPLAKPNIVLIMADDIGQGDIGAYHKLRTGQESAIPTPNIDKLANEGMIFTDAHSPASLCAPTRFSMMTGNYAFRNPKGVWGVWGESNDSGVDPNFTTIARIAKNGGYQTSFFGKWGLGGNWNREPKEYSGYEKADMGPDYFGFDYSFWTPDGIQHHPYMYFENSDWVKIKPDSKIVHIEFEQTQYLPEWGDRKMDGPGDSNWNPAMAGPKLVEKAVDYINTLEKTEKPFFLYYCSQAVHEPHTPPATLGKTKIKGKTDYAHGDMIWELDVQVGEIIKALKKNGLYENTLLVFTSDNGGLKGAAYDHTPRHDASNGWVAAKGFIEEGGHRVPFIARWPGKVKANSRSDVIIEGHDMVASLASIADVTLDGLNVRDSKSLLPILIDGDKKEIHPYIIHRSAANRKFRYAIRKGDWKLVMKTDKRDQWETLESMALYNLKEWKEESDAYNQIQLKKNKKRVEELESLLKNELVN
ncbi:sulfatase family protein [Saccharicrinis aurantiacus]|uniref:sulfatase family protein n=1 Tax=Saccharicrinis aurantiacus TaxID=1849719 RepID=UPI000838B35C|nr:arylsulfatase [Saccharicrinis aurantiacus]